jgi:hypothetical protein
MGWAPTTSWCARRHLLRPDRRCLTAAVALPCLLPAAPADAAPQKHTFTRTYKLFCVLHPVDMTATVRVKRRR